MYELSYSNIFLPERLRRQDNNDIYYLIDQKKMEAKYWMLFGAGPVHSSHSEGSGLCISSLKMKAGVQMTPGELWAGTILVVGRMGCHHL